MSISRIWHGWTTPANADIYENLLETAIFPDILARDAVKVSAGDHMDHAVVPPKARAVLARFDPISQHYEVKESRQP
jgi:hypothetical protein